LILIGSIVNAIGIILGGTLGLILKGGIPKKTTELITTGLGIIIATIGIGYTLKSQALLVVIFSTIFGSLIGELINIEGNIERFAKFAEKKMSKIGVGFSTGFVTTSILYCVGSMAILGALQSGLENKHDILYAKSLMDAVLSIVFASTLGYGVIFSAVPVFIYQGILTLLSGTMAPYIGNNIIVEMTATGGILLIGIGLNVSEIKKVKVGNMLPAIFLPPILIPLGAFLLKFWTLISNLLYGVITR